MLLLNPSLSFLHDVYCYFSSQKYSYCISYILQVVWLSVITICLSIHRWRQHKIFSLSAYESPSNGKDHVLSIPRLPDNPGLPRGCNLDCFQRSCRDIAGSGKTYNFLFLVIIIMVLFQGCMGDLFYSFVFFLLVSVAHMGSCLYTAPVYVEVIIIILMFQMPSLHAV